MDNYNPIMHGSIRAVRIFADIHNVCTPMAELAFASGVTETIQWNSAQERERYAPGITAYTIFFDERTKAKFEDFANTPGTVRQIDESQTTLWDDLRMEQQEQM